MKTIFLHAGTDKTGTTSFQTRMRSDAGILAENDIYCPGQGENYGSRRGSLHGIPKEIEERAETRPKSNPNSPPKTLADFLLAFEPSGLQKAILSSEGFYTFNEDELNIIENDLKGYRVWPILIFRHPISYLTSVYCSAGSFRRKPNIKRFLEPGLRKKACYGDKIALWLKRFPATTLMKYEDHTSIPESLFDAIGCKLSLIKKIPTRQAVTTN